MDRAVRVRALAGDTVLCSWGRHLTLTVPLSTQEYKWVLVICWGNLTNCWRVTCDGLASHPGGVEILLAASCYGNQDKLQPDEPVGSKASLIIKSKVSGLCVLKASAVKCHLIVILTLDWRSIDPWLTSQLTLNWHLSTSRSTGCVFTRTSLTS